MNELNDLMDLDPLNLSSQDIEKLVALYRKQRSDYKSGIKPKKETGPRPSISAEKLGLVNQPKPAKIGLVRRF